MIALQVIDGYISVFEVMARFGYTRPGNYWKQLLQEHRDTLPSHQMMQFVKSNGRKGRRTPGVRQEEYDQLVSCFDVAEVASSDLFDRELLKEVQQVLSLSFLDLEPELGLQMAGHTLDLYLKKPRLGMLFVSSRTSEKQQDKRAQLEQDLGKVLNGDVLFLDLHAEDFHVGKLIYQIRLHLQQARS